MQYGNLHTSGGVVRALLQWLVISVAVGATTSCARPDLQEVRAACGLGPEEYVQPVFTDKWIYTNWELSPSCVEAIGDSYGLRWGKLEPEPRRVSVPENSFDRVIGALFILAAADLGTVGEFEEKAYIPPAVRGVVSDRAEEAGLDEDAAVNIALDAWFRDNVRIIRLKEGIDPLARYNGYLKMITVNYETIDTGQEEGLISGTSGGFSAAIMFADLMHEVSHAGSVPQHITCTGTWWHLIMDEDEYAEAVEAGRLDACDADGDGAYGVSIGFLRLRQENLLIENRDDFGPMNVECDRMCIAIENRCFHINDPSDVRLCGNPGTPAWDFCSELTEPWVSDYPSVDLDSAELPFHWSRGEEP